LLKIVGRGWRHAFIVGHARMLAGRRHPERSRAHLQQSGSSS
jgi:hypothetical protein